MAARKGALIAASGATYILSAYYAYHYIQCKNSEDSDTINTSSLSSPSSFSYVTNPNRTKTFQEIASSYDKKISMDEYVLGIPLLRRYLLYTHAKGNVLEVGAGTCRNIPYYPKNGINKVVLTDSSDKMLLEALKKLKDSSSLSPEYKKKIAVVKADASNLQKFSNNSFDTVVDTFGLCSFEDPIAALKEMSRVCNKENGKILSLEHGKSNTQTMDFFAKYLDQNAEHHAKQWGCVWNRDIQDIVKQAGLTIEYMTTWHFGTTFYIVCKPSKDDE